MNFIYVEVQGIFIKIKKSWVQHLTSTNTNNINLLVVE